LNGNDTIESDARVFVIKCTICYGSDSSSQDSLRSISSSD
jgi:hypothetical protein